MAVVVILVTRHGWFEHIFVSSIPGGSTWNLVTNGSVALEERMKLSKCDESHTSEVNIIYAEMVS